MAKKKITKLPTPKKEASFKYLVNDGNKLVRNAGETNIKQREEDK